MSIHPAQGQAVIKMYTQLGSLVFAVVLGAKRAVELAPGQAARGFVTRTMLTLVAGAMLLRFVADQNQDYGLGDGIALIICAGMASGALRLLQGSGHPGLNLPVRHLAEAGKATRMRAIQGLGYFFTKTDCHTCHLWESVHLGSVLQGSQRRCPWLSRTLGIGLKDCVLLPLVRSQWRNVLAPAAAGRPSSRTGPLGCMWM